MILPKVIFRRKYMKGSLVVITGGNSGLGLELVKLFKKAHKVLVIARNKRTEFKDVFYE